MLHKEAVANLVGKYLSNAQYIEKLANADRHFMYRAYRAIKGMRADIAAAQQISAETERSAFTEYRTLRRMEKVFETALGLTEKQVNREIDFIPKSVYNRKKVARYIPYDSIGGDAVRHIKSTLQKIYGNEDGIADGIAISFGEKVYTIDSGRENGKINFGIRRQRTISDVKLRAKFIRSTNNDAVSKGFVSYELSSRIGDGLVGDFGRDMRRESRSELQTDSRESKDNEKDILGENANNGRISNSAISRSVLSTDRAYLDTVEKGDMETARRWSVRTSLRERFYRPKWIQKRNLTAH